MHKMVFRTHKGNFECIVMPFGLSKAPVTFNATMNYHLKPFLCKLVIVFFDDIELLLNTLAYHLF